MNSPLFSLLHATARPAKWAATYAEWIAKAVNPADVEYVLCIDERWGFPAPGGSVFFKGGRRDRRYSVDVLAWNTGPQTAVSQWNTAGHAATGALLLVVADDFFPCNQWDVKLLELLERAGISPDQIATRDFAVRVADGTPADEQGHICHAILSRGRLEHQGGFVYHPEYSGVFCDNDFTSHAEQDKAIIEARDVIRFDHRHAGYRFPGGFSRENKELDAVWWHHNKPEDYAQGRAIFERRELERFGHPELIPLREGERDDEQAGAREGGPALPTTIALCLSGDDFRGAWVDGILTLYSHLVDRGFAIWRVREYTSNVYVTRAQLLGALRSLVTPPELVLWLDDDNILTPAQFDALLDDLEKNPELDGVTGWSWIHDEELKHFYVSCGIWAPDRIRWQPFDARTFPQSNALERVEVSGFPAFLMRWRALEAVGERPFLPILDERLPHGLAGEDISFCRKAGEAGVRFAVDPRVHVPHLRYVAMEPEFPALPIREPKVAAMLRVRNEGRWIARAVESLRELCGERVYVLDDASGDDTVERARAAGATVQPSPFEHTDDPDEARDKNWFLGFVKDACAPDWILCIDGDEELEPGGAAKIRSAIASARADCYALRFLHLWNDTAHYRGDRWYSTFTRLSLFRPVEGYGFQSLYAPRGIKAHSGLHTGNAPAGMRFAVLNVYLIHYGYMLKDDRIRKYRYYTRIDPDNETEDFYRHTVQGDIPEVPAGAVLKHAGPLEIRDLPARLHRPAVPELATVTGV